MSQEAEKFVSDLIEYARERNRFIERHEPAYFEFANALPCPLPPQSVTPWTEEQIDSAKRALTESPTRRQTLEIFLKFLMHEAQNLILYGGRPGFYRQHAFNLVADGPIGRAAESAVADTQATPMLVRTVDTACLQSLPSRSLLIIGIDIRELSLIRNQ